MIHKSRFDIIADIAGADSWQHDPWGTSMNLFFDIAAVLDMSDVEGNVTPEPFARWQYRPANVRIGGVNDLESVAARADDFSEGEFAGDYSYGTIMLASALVEGDITQADLIYAGNVLDRYTELLRRAERDY